MIEGLRALPWLEEARSKDGQKDTLDCDACMERTTYQIRQRMRCGYLPDGEHIDDSMRWIPDGMSAKDVTICPGYTTTLPEVIDAIANYHHYETGQITEACGGPPAPSLLHVISILKGAVLSKDAYRMREQAKKNQQNGGGHGNR